MKHSFALRGFKGLYIYIYPENAPNPYRAPRVFRAPHICVIWTRHLIEAIDIATADEMLTLHEGFYRPLAFSK